MRWQYKYAIQRTLSAMPMNFGGYLNNWLSVHFGGQRKPQAWGFSNTLGMVALLDKIGFRVEGKRVVELGTGWDGSSALVLLSLGAESVSSFDLFRHLDQCLLDKSSRTFDDLGPYTSKVFPFETDLPSVAGTCRAELIDMRKFHYFAPHDARATGLPSESADLYYSQAVLEHVDAKVLISIHSESLRILKPGGVCFHYVQPTMHAAWMDSKATGIDYLTCSDRQWRWLFENGIAHENRLRGVDHVRILQEAGFETIGVWNSIDEKALSALPTKKLAARFHHYTPEEIATDYCWIISRKPLGPPRTFAGEDGDQATSRP